MALVEKPPAGGLRRARWRLKRVLRPLVEVQPAPEGVVTDWDVPVVVRDGTTLRVNVFRPSGGEPVPVILSMHPYRKDTIPARSRSGRGVNMQYRMMPQPRPVRFSAWTGWEAPDPGVWVPRGYAVINADSRGSGTSEGRGTLLSDHEAQDYADVIAWAGTQPWSTGRVGLDGVSYLAISQYKVAALHPPHLTAICPWEGFCDLYRDFARPGGVREDGFSILWSRLTRAKARVDPDVRAEIRARPERDAWYDSVTPQLEQINVPVLVCGSFSDHNLHTRGSFEVFRRAGSTQKWLYTHRDGKWAHYYGLEATRTRARFFDHFLKGEDNGWDSTAPVRLAVHEEGPDAAAVTAETAWPPADLTWTTLALDPATHTLAPVVPTLASQIQFGTRSAGVAFTWRVPQDMDAIGPMAARLFLETPDLDDANIFLAVRKFRSGRECLFEGSFGFDRDLVTTGWQRLAFRHLDPALSSPAQPVHTFRGPDPVRPGEVVAVDVALREQATRFRAGDELRLTVRGTWHHPRDPVRGQTPSGYTKSRRGTLVLHGGAGTPSTLLLGHRPL